MQTVTLQSVTVVLPTLELEADALPREGERVEHL